MDRGGRYVFMIGPGFIGWNVLDILVKQNYTVTALARSEKKADRLLQSGATPVRGDLTDLALIQECVTKSDIVYQIATGDNIDLVNSILAGVEARSVLGTSTIYVHTSGAKVLDDGALGMYKSDHIYTDADRAGIDSVSDEAPHRDVDLTIIRAQRKLHNSLKAAIMLPPEVYGYDAKHQKLSMMIPKMTRFTLKHGYPPMIGHGLSVETQVHVMDLARGYVDVLHYLETASEDQVLANPYWLSENGKEFSWREAADVIGNALVKAGRITDPTPREPPQEFWSELSGPRTAAYMGLNCRAQAVRLRELGWQPREKGIWESYLEDELPIILAETDSEAGGHLV